MNIPVSAIILATFCAAFSAFGATSSPVISPPDPVKQKGLLTFCSDLENPPAEGVADDGKTPVGAEVEIMKAIGSMMGVRTEIDNYQFSGIFAALDTGKCDLVMASLGKTPERAQRYWLVDYWSVASGLLVSKGNPHHLNKFEDLSGQRVSVLLGSRNGSVVKQISDKLVAEGKPPITIIELNSYVVAYQYLALGRADALVGDTVVINYYGSKSQGRFEVGGVPVPPKTWAIAIPKSSPDLRDAVQAAIDKMNVNGQMATLTKTWGIEKGVALCATTHPCE